MWLLFSQRKPGAIGGSETDSDASLRRSHCKAKERERGPFQGKRGKASAGHRLFKKRLLQEGGSYFEKSAFHEQRSAL
jgi:hypothetical protein